MDIIVTHANADFDALASLVAASKLYPNAKIVLPAMQERGVRDFLAILHDLVRVESEKSIDFKKMRRLIIVDTRLKNRIGKAQEFLNNPGLKIHCYDHHPQSKNDLSAVRNIYRRRGATVTILLEIIKKRKMPISPLEATVFALGIYEDTGSLTFQSTTKKDIDMVGYLFSRGANLSLISLCLNKELSDAEMHLLSAMIDATRTYRISGVNVGIASVISRDQALDLAWVMHKLLEIENLNVLFALINVKDRIQMIARSRLKFVDVNKIVRKFGGGGHHSAASATIRAKKLEDIESELVKILKNNIKADLKAKDVMTEDVETFRPRLLVAQAKKAMDKLQLNAVAVVERGKLEGIIQRADIERALNNGYAHAPIKAYMRKKAVAVDFNTPAEDVHAIMSKRRLECMPVIHKGKLSGIINLKDVFMTRHKEILNLAVRKDKISGKRKARLKNLKNRIKRIAPMKIRKILKKMSETADNLNMNAFIVGGFVRDLILDKPNFDMDIVVEGDAIVFAENLQKILRGKLKCHNRFKTAKLMLDNGVEIDIATARTEFYGYPAALPVVESSSLRHDLLRRDFTINTLALSLNKRTFGTLIDFFQGEKDIKEKKIHVLHDLSFVEDPTRIFRALRFEQRFDFKIDAHTENLIKAAVDLEMFDRLHKFRIGDELMQLLNEPYPLKVIRRMSLLHELKFIHPRIKFDEKMVGLLESVQEVLGWYKLSFPGKAVQRWIVYLLVIFDRLNSKSLQETFNNFAFGKRAKNCILKCKHKQKKIVTLLSAKEKIVPSRICRILRGLPLETVLFFMAKSGASEKKEIFIKFLTKYVNIKLKISGEDLKLFAPKSGPRFKKALEETLEAKVDGKVSGKSDELKFARSILCS